MFQFSPEPDDLDEHTTENRQMYQAYKDKNFRIDGRKRDYLMNLGTNIQNMRKDAQSHYYSLSSKRRNKMLDSKGLKAEDVSFWEKGKQDIFLAQERMQELGAGTWSKQESGDDHDGIVSFCLSSNIHGLADTHSRYAVWKLGKQGACQVMGMPSLTWDTD